MIRRLPVTISILFCCFYTLGQLVAQPSRMLKAPDDKFSKAFLKIYKESNAGFDKLKGKQVNTGDETEFMCRTKLPGSLAGNIAKGDSPYCVFNFESYETLPDAEEAMLKLSAKNY